MKRLAIALSCLAAQGCFQLAQPAPRIDHYRLEYSPPQLGLAPLHLVLRIGNVDVAAAYDREPIVYRKDEFTDATYFYHRWSGAPGQLIHDILVRDFAAAGTYQAVQASPALVPADYELSLYVETISEEPRGSTCAALLSGRAALIRQQSPKPAQYVATFAYRIEEPVACNDPPALVAAMSRDLARLSEQLQRDLHGALAP